jgi:hypothetical protein
MGRFITHKDANAINAAAGDDITRSTPTNPDTQQKPTARGRVVIFLMRPGETQSSSKLLENSEIKATAKPTKTTVINVSMTGYYYETPENKVEVNVFTTYGTFMGRKSVISFLNLVTLKILFSYKWVSLW